MIDIEIHNRLRQQFNPDGSDLRRQQMVLLDMLVKFDTFCKKRDITYWLSSGSVLGAVRHGGFIPWDDDVDVEMLSDDYKKLEASSEELYNETGIILQNHKSDIEYIAPYPKLRDTASELKEIHENDHYYKYKGIYIDIFVRDKTSKLSAFISHGYQYVSYRLTRMRNRSLRLAMKQFCYVSLHKLLIPALNVFDKLFYKSGGYRVVKGSGYYTSFDYDDLLPVKQICFEGKTLSAPNNANRYLEKLFGDYMKLPDIDNLHPHYNKLIFKDEQDS